MTSAGHAHVGGRRRPTTPHLHRRVPPQRLIDALNPIVRRLADSPAHGLLDRSTLVLHVRGRSTGRHYDIPVTYADIGSELFVLTEHKWRRNLHGGVDLDVTWHGQRTPMHAEVTETPEDSARLLLAIVQRLGWRAARRRFGLRTTDGESPTAADLRLLAATEDLAVLTLTSDETWRDGVVDGR